MATSIFAPANRNQVITVQDCAQSECPSPSGLANGFLSAFGGDVFPTASSNLAYAMDSFTGTDFPSVFIMGLDSSRVRSNSFNAIRVSGWELDSMTARYGLVEADAPFIIDTINTSIATAAAAWTNINATLATDLDYVATWALSQRVRLFGRMFRLTVADDIQRIEIQNVTASPYVELISISLKPDDCREIVGFMFQRAQSNRFVGSISQPVQQNTLHYQLPLLESDQDTTATNLLQVRVFDNTGAQVASTVGVDVWAVPYTQSLANAFTSFRGIAGGRAVMQPAGAIINIPNTQPTI